MTRERLLTLKPGNDIYKNDHIIYLACGKYDIIAHGGIYSSNTIMKGSYSPITNQSNSSKHTAFDETDFNGYNIIGWLLTIIQPKAAMTYLRLVSDYLFIKNINWKNSCNS